MHARKKKAFQDIVLNYFAEHGRQHLPWRQKPSPYRVLVSEIMLQQTQVERVIPFFERWMKAFPNFKKLAEAPQAEVLRLWKGLGYNSRALRLYRLAEVVTKEYRGKLPESQEMLMALPGIGPYTAGAVRAFAFNQDEVFIETNIRRVFIHHFFKDHGQIHDAEILELVRKTLPEGQSAHWYAALMDYGSHLASQIENPNRRSRHYAKQSKFEGSDRQIRGKILEYLLEKNLNKVDLIKKLANPEDRVEKILTQLADEGFIVIQKDTIFLK